MINKITIDSIKLYQTYLSPLKGFKCAHGVYFKGDSCSCAIKKIVERRGIVKGLPDIKKQFQRCAEASQLIKRKKYSRKKSQGQNSDHCIIVDYALEIMCCSFIH